MSSQEMVTIGVFGRAFGIKGGLSFKLFDPYADYGEVLKKDSELSIETRAEPLSIEQLISIDSRGNHLMGKIQLHEIKNRTQAEKLTGKEIKVPLSSFVGEQIQVNGKEFGLLQIQNFEVNCEGQKIGNLEGFYRSPAHPVMVVKDNHGSNLEMPFVREKIQEIDFHQKTILVTGPFLEIDGE